MTPEALITMGVVWLIVTYFTVHFFVKVLKKPIDTNPVE